MNHLISTIHQTMILLSIFLTFLTQAERPFSGKYLYETKEGIYHCVNCKNPLFSSENKYDSGSGWPSFTYPIEPQAIYYLKDEAFPFMRYEVLCRGCNSHLGHVFRDGPPPKHLRYCINSIALQLEIQ